MATEQIQKFQPNRTIYLRGFDGAGAAAALYYTAASSFKVSGVYRDMADFCVLVIYDADNIFEHYSVRYLPDFNLAGMVLNFDVSYQGLQPLDSAKFSWIDWSQLDVITSTGTTAQIVLFDHATLVSGSYTPAQGTFTITTGTNGCNIYDRLTLFINNTAFDFVTGPSEVGYTAGQVVTFFVDNINAYNWAAFLNNSVAVIASNGGSGQLIIKYARTGYVNTDGSNLVTWTAVKDQPLGIKFPGLPAGSAIYINGTAYTIQAVTSPTTLTLTTTAPSQTNVPYLAEYGGLDGNGLTVYMVVRANVSLFVDQNGVLPLTGGNSDNVTWNISLDFTALGIDSIRQAWFTLAPQLPSDSTYADTEWTAAYTNWSVTDPNNIRTLQIAGPNSIRIGNADTGCVYSSAGWSVQSANNYWRGFSRVTNTALSSLTVTYTSSEVHDLYLGTSLYTDRGIVSVSVDNDSSTTLNCYLDTGSELVTRRLLRSSLAAGSHTVVITLTAKADGTSSGYFIFDYMEAAIATPDIADPIVTYANVSPALDYDTDATYKMSPQRILWHLEKLGFLGHMNEYLGVFWWNQRIREGETWNAVAVTIGGTWADSEYAELNIGGFIIRKSVLTWDTNTTIANHFVYYINSSTVAVWAAITGDGEFTIYIRTPNWFESVTTTPHSTSGTMTMTFQNFVIVTLAGTFAAADTVELTINGTAITETFGESDTTATIAFDLVAYLNSSSLNVTAVLSDVDASQFTVSPAAPGTTVTAQVSYSSTAPSSDSVTQGTATVGVGGTPGYWQVDASASNPLNFAIRQWHADLFSQLQAAGRLITTSFSMELVYPPDDGTVANAWEARFYDGTAVTTDTGFAHLLSSQCAFIPNMTAFQQQVFLAMATLQSAAGLTPWLQFGEFLWWFFPSGAFVVSSVTGTSPIAIGLGAPHGLATGDRVVITGVHGCTAVNGTWTITVIDAATFSIPAVSNGTWTSGTGTVRGGSMAYYDAVTSAAAQSALGRPLYKFTCQDDDPGVNGGADTSFLAARLKAHTDAIASTVLAQFPNAKFEVLYPNDVNNPVCLQGPGVTYSQGGRLNAAVNLPVQWHTQPGSGLDSFKVEALSWSANYQNMDRAQQAIVFALTPPMSWDISNVAYLVPWFNGTCPWPREFLSASSRQLNIVNFWAYDHLALMSWPIPLPVSLEKTSFLG